MRVGSLCTGYGGLEMGIEQAFGPIELVFVSDIDKDVGTLLAHHHPDTPNLGDLTKVNWKKQQPVDLLCAGYPCQPFSVAGKKKGEEDERAIFGWIADAISVLRPERILLENVAGHLTLGGVGVIAELTSLGYDCRWGLVRASDAGAPHRRERLFIWAEITHPDSSGRKEHSRRITMETEQRPSKRDGFAPGGDRQLRRITKQAAPINNFNPSRIKYEPAIQKWAEIIGREAPPAVHNKWADGSPQLNPCFVEWMMGLPEGHVTGLGLSRVAQLKMLGNGVVPQQAALAVHYLTQERVSNAA